MLSHVTVVSDNHRTKESVTKHDLRVRVETNNDANSKRTLLLLDQIIEAPVQRLAEERNCQF